MNTKKVLKKINSLNLFERITFEQDNDKVIAVFKKATLTDGTMTDLLKTFPSKKYDLEISFQNGILQIIIKPTIFQYLGKIQPIHVSDHWPCRSSNPLHPHFHSRFPKTH